MPLPPKRNSEDASFRGIVGRAFGSRSPKATGDPAPELDEVLTNLHISEQEYSQPFEINRVHFAETPAEPAGQPGTNSPYPELEAHRQRLEQLLESARQIEEMLAKEAAQARSLGENLKLDEKRALAAEAAEGERKATAEARAYAQNSETAAAYQVKAESELAASRAELTAAEASVRELQARLRDAQDLAVVSKAKVLEAESRSKEAAKRADLAMALVRDAEIRVAKCREAREAAQAQVTHAEEIANSIALTAETLKRIRKLGSPE
jgi:hypothetical protein